MNITRKPHTLKRIILRISLPYYLLIFIIFSVILFGSIDSARKATVSYINSIAESAEHSLSLIDSRIRHVGGTLSSFAPFVNLCLRDSILPVDNFMRASDAVSFTVGYMDNVRDICLITRDREIINFFTGYVNEYTNDLFQNEPYDFSSDSLSATNYFFPGYQTQFGDYFLYLCPVVHIDPYTHASTRAGTLVLTCEMATLDSLLQSIDLDCPNSRSITDADGNTVLRISSDDFTEDSRGYTVTRDIGTLRLSITVPESVIIRQSNFYTTIYFLGGTSLILLLTLLYYSRVMHHSLTEPVNRLIEALPSITLKDPVDRLPVSNIEEINIITDNINRLVSQLAVMSADAVQSEHEIIEAELRKNEAELYALQSQINPHFIFNTLQCIRSLAIIGESSAVSTVCNGMSRILRYSLAETHIVPIEEEVEITERYLDICRIRYQNKHSYEIAIADELYGYSCPRLILQPLVENAIVHGLSTSENGGTIRICGSRDNEIIILDIADNGTELSAERQNELLNTLNGYPTHETGKKHGYGLENIHRRIQLEYGDIYGLEISVKDGWKHFTIHFPAVLFSPAPLAE